MKNQPQQPPGQGLKAGSDNKTRTQAVTIETELEQSSWRSQPLVDVS